MSALAIRDRRRRRPGTRPDTRVPSSPPSRRLPVPHARGERALMDDRPGDGPGVAAQVHLRAPGPSVRRQAA